MVCKKLNLINYGAEFSGRVQVSVSKTFATAVIACLNFLISAVVLFKCGPPYICTTYWI